MSASFLLAVAGFAFISFAWVDQASANQPNVTYSATTPAPGVQVTATLSGSPTVSGLQWQWSLNGISWGNAGEAGATTTTITVPNKPGFMFRYTWVRNNVREYATTYVTVTASTVSYSTAAPRTRNRCVCRAKLLNRGHIPVAVVVERPLVGGRRGDRLHHYGHHRAEQTRLHV